MSMAGRLTGKLRILTLFPFFFEKENPYDKVVTEKDLEFENLTGFQRLKKLFESDQDHAFNPTLVQISQTTCLSLIGGGIYGGCIKSRYAFIDFIEKNEATQFLSQHDAKRRLADKVFTSFYQGFTRYGLRVACFCTSLMTTYTVLAVYNNKDSILYYSVSGAVAGALYKFSLGPRGMIAGAIFGSFFASVYGGIKWTMLTITNMTEENLRQAGYEMKEIRDDAKNRAFKELHKRKEKQEILEAVKHLS